MEQLRDAPRGRAFDAAASFERAAVMERHGPAVCPAVYPVRPRRGSVITAVLAFGAAAISLGSVAGLTVWQLLARRSPPVEQMTVTVAHPPPYGRLIPAPAPGASGEPYFEFQVEKPVVPAPGNAGPRYPDILRSANVEGEVLAQFVVDHHGHPDMWTFKVLRSSHPLFTRAVREAVAESRYVPAELGGARVNQLVQQPFVFQLTR